MALPSDLVKKKVEALRFLQVEVGISLANMGPKNWMIHRKLRSKHVSSVALHHWDMTIWFLGVFVAKFCWNRQPKNWITVMLPMGIRPVFRVFWGWSGGSCRCGLWNSSSAGISSYIKWYQIISSYIKLPIGSMYAIYIWWHLPSIYPQC